MGDLTQEQSTQYVSVTDEGNGNTVSVTGNNKIRTSNSISGSGVTALRQISNSTPTPARAVVSANLANRNILIITNKVSNRSLYWSFTSTGMNAANSHVIPGDSTLTIQVSDSVDVFLLGDNNNQNVVISEAT